MKYKLLLLNYKNFLQKNWGGWQVEVGVFEQLFYIMYGLQSKPVRNFPGKAYKTNSLWCLFVF